MISQDLLLAIFWGASIIILYCFLGFPLLLAVRAILFPQRKARTKPNYFPRISVIIAAHNEADVITKKIDSILASNYPRDLLEILVASDGSTDKTNELVSSFNTAVVRLLALPRLGKNLALNEAVKIARGEVLIFTDADNVLEPDSLRNLVAPFADPEVGGVSGDFRHAGQEIKQAGERAYWNYDRMLKRLQSRRGSVSAATGSGLYAIRSSLYRPVPPTVTDDFFSAMQVVSAHQRLIFEPQAVAYGPVAPSASAEFKRKVRVITRGFHAIWLMRHLLNPFSYGFFAVQLFTHKLLRRLIVFPLILLAVTAPLLWSLGWVYKFATIVQIVFHTIALIGFFLQRTRLGQSKLISLPFHFDLVYYASLVALVNNLRGNLYATWDPERIQDP